MSASAIEEPRVSPDVAQVMRRFSRRSGVAVAMLGGLALMGWLVHSDILRTLVPGHVSAKPNTALALLAAGLARWVATGAGGCGRRRASGSILATLVGLIGGATLAQYLLGVNLGIDQILFQEEGGALETPCPGRMSVITCLEFLLFALAFHWQNPKRPRLRSAAQWAGLSGLVAAGTALLGYTFGAHTLYGYGWGTSISLPAALGFAVLFAGTLAADPEIGWMASLAGDRAGGVLLRRLLPFAILGPWIVGWITVAGSSAGLYSTAADQVAFAAALIVVFVWLLFVNARALDRVDVDREQRQAEVEALNRELEDRVLRRTAELVAANDALQRSENNLKDAQRIAHLGNWELDLVSNVLSWSEETYRIFGIGPGNGPTSYEAFLETVHPDDRALVDKAYMDSVKNRMPYDIVHRLLGRDGGLKYVHERGETSYDLDGRPVRSIGTVLDITERKQAEEQMQKQAALLHLAPAGIMVRDVEGRIVFWSRGAEELYGWTIGEACGRLVHDLLQTRFPAPLPQIEAAVLRGEVWEGELQHTKRNGERITVASRWALQRGPLGNPEGILEINVDISARKRDELELQRLNRILKTLSRCTEAVARAGDEDSLLQQVCDVIVQIAGYPLAWVGYAGPDEPKEVRPVAVAGLGAEYVRSARITWGDTERGRGPTGTAIRTGQPCCIGDVVSDPRFTPWREAALHHGYASVMAAPLKDEDRAFGALNIYAPEPHAFDAEEQSLLAELASTLSYGIVALRARQERDRSAAQLRELNETLEGRVAERTAELAAANQELESFTYSVSHDLRAPLRHIDGFSKVMLEQYGEAIEESGRHYLERVRQATQHMGKLVDDLLNLSRLGRRALRLEATDLTRLAATVVDEMHEDAAGRPIEWSIDLLPTLPCDPSLMRQVFFNLLSNAVKFTRGRDPAMIQVGAEGSELFVRDNGVGFDPGYADKLFGVFQRLHRSEEFEGTGVGLATVRRILRKHGGDIRAESQPGHGATFYFTLGTPGEVPSPADREVVHAF